MSNTVKLYTRIDGKPSEIGLCHAGQARLLRKKGLATWEDGKLWLVSPESIVRVDLPKDADPNAVVAAVKGALGPHAYVVEVSQVDKAPAKLDPEYLKVLLMDAGIDSSEWDDASFDLLAQKGGQEYPEISVAGASALCHEWRRRTGLGHDTCNYDDPRARRIGFMDYTAQEYVYTPLTMIKERRGIDPQEAEAMGTTPEELMDLFVTVRGREQLFGHGGFGTGGEAEELEPIDWGSSPPDITAFFKPDIRVGLTRVAPPVRMPALKVGEDRQAGLERLRQDHQTAYLFPLVEVRGWTYFTVSEGARQVIPVLDGEGTPHPSLSEEPVYGLFKRRVGRLFRVWLQGRDAGWDESILQEDCTYRLVTEHTIRDAPAHEHITEATCSVEARIEALTMNRDASHEVGPDWKKFFDFKSCPPVFYMDIPPSLFEAYAFTDSKQMTEEEAAHFASKMVRMPYGKLHGESRPVYGFYRVVRDRLFRVLGSYGQTCVWDESVRAPDGSYTLRQEGRSIDKMVNDMGHIDLLAPAGFPETLKAAEQRIEEYLMSPDVDWTVTTHKV